MGFDMHVPSGFPLAKWHSIASDSFFSGMLFRFDEDFEKVVVECIHHELRPERHHHPAGKHGQ